MRRFSSIMIFVGILSLTVYGGGGMLTKGAVAPQFELMGADGITVKLSDFKGKKYVVLVFYPGDETPVCTQQLCEIRDDYTLFEKKGAVVFGVNPASDASHGKFSEKHGFQFPLLVDEKKKVAARYGAKGALMNKRTVYVIDKEGLIVFAQRGKPPVQEILAAIPPDTINGTPDSSGIMQLKMK